MSHSTLAPAPSLTFFGKRPGNPITPSALSRLDPPTPLGPRHRPFPHYEGFSLVSSLLASNNLTPLSPGEHYVNEAATSYIAAIPVVPTPPPTPSPSSPDLPPSENAFVVIRNSTNQTRAFTLTFGLNLALCSNGRILGNILGTAARRHTIPTDLTPQVLTPIINHVLSHFLPSIQDELSFEATLRNSFLTDAEAAHLLVRLSRTSSISSSDILPVFNFFKEPVSMLAPSATFTSSEANDHYVPSSAYCLYNAITARLRDTTSSLALYDRFPRIRSFLSTPTTPSVPA